MTKGRYSFDEARSQHSFWFEHVVVSDWHFNGRGEGGGMAMSCGFAIDVLEGINVGPMQATMRSRMVYNTVNARSGVEYSGKTLFEARQQDQTTMDIHSKVCSPINGCHDAVRYNFLARSEIRNESQ
jgi:hypothetical protein